MVVGKSGLAIGMSLVYISVAIIKMIKNREKSIILFTFPIVAAFGASLFGKYSLIERLLLYSFPLIIILILTGLSIHINYLKDKSKKAIIRNKLDSYYYLDAKRKGLPILGICHGAQFIAKKEGARIVFKKQKIKKHKIYSKKNI